MGTRQITQGSDLGAFVSNPEYRVEISLHGEQDRDISGAPGQNPTGFGNGGV